MGRCKMKALKTTSHIFAVLAAVSSIVYKLKLEYMVNETSAIGVIINTERKGR